MLFATIAFVVFIFLGVPVSFSLGASSLVFLLKEGISVGLIAQRMFTGLDSFPFMAIPFFVLSGELMNHAGISKRLVRMADVFVGRMRGGLGHVNVLTSMFFAGITGSAVADTSSEGPLIIPAMVSAGYSPDYAAAITCASSVIGPIIPPSIPFVVYSLISSTSVAALFLAGLVPGVLLGISQMIANAIISKRRNYPRSERWPTFKEMFGAVLQGMVPMMMPIIILGGILGGVFTATEAAAVAVIYALVIGLLVYRNIGWKDLKEAFISTAKTTGVVFLLIACSNVFNWALVVEQIPQSMALFIAHTFTSKFFLLMAINVMLLIVGCFMEGTAALIILVPILLQITKPFGVDPVMLGVLVVLNLMIGLITPPVGLCLHIACNIAKRPMEMVAKALVPFLVSSIATLLLVTYVEPISLFLPRLLGYIR
jgi:tripartite ATP-independent transporter DctM subunit